MNVEFGTKAEQFPEKEYINGIFVAVWYLVLAWYMVLGSGTWCLVREKITDFWQGLRSKSHEEKK